MLYCNFDDLIVMRNGLPRFCPITWQPGSYPWSSSNSGQGTKGQTVRPMRWIVFIMETEKEERGPEQTSTPLSFIHHSITFPRATTGSTVIPLNNHE